MLLVLAWLLGLYHWPNPKLSEQDAEDDDVTTLKSNELGNNRRYIKEDEIAQTIGDVSHHGMFDDLQDWDFGTAADIKEAKVKEAKLLKQLSIQGTKGDDLCVIDDSNVFVGADLPYSEAKKVNLASQPSIKRDRGQLYSPNSSFTPVQRTKSPGAEHLDVSGEEKTRKSSTSTLSIQVNNDHANTHNELSIQVNNDHTSTHNEVSVYEQDMEPSPLKMQFGAVNMDQESLEDSEVALAFSSSHQNEADEDDDMQYTTRNGTKVTITHEAAGRIHSIVVKDKTSSNLPITKITSRPAKPSKIRVASPRMRATSPRVRAENVSPSIISMHQRTNQSEEEEMVHLVVNKNHLDVSATSREHIVVPEERRRIPVSEDVIAAPVHSNMVQSGNPKVIGKLPPQQRNKKGPNFLEKQTRAPTDFDAIMNKRKKFVDTMDDAGRLLGQIAHRDEKLAGGRKELSKHWLKIREAVLRRQYLNFKEKSVR